MFIEHWDPLPSCGLMVRSQKKPLPFGLGYSNDFVMGQQGLVSMVSKGLPRPWVPWKSTWITVHPEEHYATLIYLILLANQEQFYQSNELYVYNIQLLLWVHCGNTWRPPKWEQAEAVYLEPAIARESATISWPGRLKGRKRNGKAF